MLLALILNNHGDDFIRACPGFNSSGASLGRAMLFLFVFVICEIWLFDFRYLLMAMPAISKYKGIQNSNLRSLALSTSILQ